MSLQELIQMINPQLQAAQQTRADALSEYTQEPGYTSGQAVSAGLIGLAPLIAGLIKGGKSVPLGAQLGMGAVNAYGASLEDDEKKKDRQALALYEQAKADSKDLGNQKFQLEKEQARIEEVAAHGGYKKGGLTVNLPSQEQKVSLDEGTAKELGFSATLNQRVNNFKERVTEIAKTRPEIMDKYFDSKTGEFNLDKALSVGGQSVQAALFGAATGRGDLLADYNAIALDVIKAASGLQYTDAQLKKIEASLGKGLLPQDIPTTLRVLERVSGELQGLTEAKVAAVEIARQKLSPVERKEAFSNLFKSLNSQYGSEGGSRISNALNSSLAADMSGTRGVNPSQGDEGLLGSVGKMMQGGGRSYITAGGVKMDPADINNLDATTLKHLIQSGQIREE